MPAGSRTRRSSAARAGARQPRASHTSASSSTSVPVRSAPRRPRSVSRAEPADPRAVADALFRCALECCRQHDRYARLVEHEAIEAEQEAARTLVGCCDRALTQMVDAYGAAARRPEAAEDERWWHDANRLWYASREWLRRCEGETRVQRHASSRTPIRFLGLTVEYDLAASALLLLQQAVAGYAHARPDAATPGARATRG